MARTLFRMAAAGAPLCVVAATLGGCADTTAMRGLASHTSSALTQDSSSLAAFIATSNQSNRDRATTLADLQMAEADAQVSVERKRNGWALAARKDELALLAQIQRVRPADIVAGLPAPPPAMPALDDGGAGASLDEAAATYKAMARLPKFKDRVKEIFDAGQAVRRATQAIKDKAASPS